MLPQHLSLRRTSSLSPWGQQTKILHASFSSVYSTKHTSCFSISAANLYLCQDFLVVALRNTKAMTVTDISQRSNVSIQNYFSVCDGPRGHFDNKPDSPHGWGKGRWTASSSRKKMSRGPRRFLQVLHRLLCDQTHRYMSRTKINWRKEEGVCVFTVPTRISFSSQISQTSGDQDEKYSAWRASANIHISFLARLYNDGGQALVSCGKKNGKIINTQLTVLQCRNG